MATTPHQRNLVDALKVVTKALPAAAANADSAAIDLGQVNGGLIENIAFELEVPATPALVEAKTITFSVKDSADNSSFAAIDPAITTVITGAGSAAGGAAKTVRFRLPPTARRYIAVNAAVLADGGNNTGVSFTFRALF
jgi:hypothetical protein